MATDYRSHYYIVVDKKSNDLIWFQHYFGGGGGYEIPMVFQTENHAKDYFKNSDDFDTDDIGRNGDWKIKKISKADLPNYL